MERLKLTLPDEKKCKFIEPGTGLWVYNGQLKVLYASLFSRWLIKMLYDVAVIWQSEKLETYLSVNNSWAHISRIISVRRLRKTP